MQSYGKKTIAAVKRSRDPRTATRAPRRSRLPTTGRSETWIVEAARKIRQRRFGLDGEAVVLGVDKHDEEVQLCAFDIRTMTICGSCRSTFAR